MTADPRKAKNACEADVDRLLQEWGSTPLKKIARAGSDGDQDALIAKFAVELCDEARSRGLHAALVRRAVNDGGVIPFIRHLADEAQTPDAQRT